MKKLTILITTLIITSSSFAFDDYAIIKKVEPQYSNINQPIEVCRDEVIQETRYPQQSQYQQPQERNYGGATLGAVAGGILGHQVGKGNGNTVATAAGAVIGALVGDNMGNTNSGGNIQQQYQPPQNYSRTVRNCHMEDNINQVLSGYKIDYIYNGKIFNYVAQEKPINNKIRVDVQVQPSLY